MGKLVRSEIPALMRKQGLSPQTRQLDDREFEIALYDKLKEEAGELRTAAPGTRLDEAADVLEALMAILNLHGLAIEDVREAAAAKQAISGDFSARTWLESKPQGSLQEPATQVEFAQKALIESSAGLLCVRKTRADPDMPGLWDLPGGRLQGGEDLDASLKREVWEEVGLEVEIGRPVHCWAWRRMNAVGEQVRVVGVARLCTTRAGAIVTTNRDTEDYLGDASWVRRGDLHKLPLIPGLRQVVDLYFGVSSAHLRSSK